MKKLITIAAISTAALLLTACGNEAKAFMQDADQAGSMEQSMTGDAKARAGGSFYMNFVGNASTEGNFNHRGMAQDIFNTEETPYYYPSK